MSLRSNLSAYLKGSCSRQGIDAIVTVCHALASAYIRSKITRGQLRPDRFGLTPSDIAMDCIADLFRQDANGRMVQITNYFEGIDMDDTCDVELLSHLRRLVFSKVNQGLFRLFSEHDPGFGKILRNVKLSLNALQNFVEIDKFGETWIAPAMCDTLDHLPSVSAEYREVQLHKVATGGEELPIEEEGSAHKFHPTSHILSGRA